MGVRKIPKNSRLLDISEYPNISIVADGDYLVISKSGITKKIMVASLAASGGFAAYIKNNIAGSGAPTVNNDSSQGYSVGSKWFDVTTSPKNCFICLGASVGAATWLDATLELSDLGSMAVQNANAVNVSGGAITGITDLIVADGGTGLSTLTDHSILLGSGTDAITPLAVLGAGEVLYGVAANDPVALAANATATKKFLTETSSAPGWNEIVSGDLTTALTTPPAIGGSTPAAGSFTGVTLSDAGKITLDVAPASDHTATGIIASETVGDTVVFGDVLYMNADGKWHLADADAAATMPGMRMVVDETITDDAAGNLLQYGIARDDSWSWVIGGLIYVSTGGTTTTTLSQTAPSGDGDQVQIVGTALTADVMAFAPSPVVTEIGLDIEAKTTGYTVTVAELSAIPKTFTCESTITFNLPSVDASNVGLAARFAKMGAGTVTIDAADSDTIEDSGAGDTIYCADPGYATITLQLMLATEWIITAATGTWTVTT